MTLNSVSSASKGIISQGLQELPQLKALCRLPAAWRVTHSLYETLVALFNCCSLVKQECPVKNGRPVTVGSTHWTETEVAKTKYDVLYIVFYRTPLGWRCKWLWAAHQHPGFPWELWITLMHMRNTLSCAIMKCTTGEETSCFMKMWEERRIFFHGAGFNYCL